jgi:CubicO group peptidase (beta-lactamase class C family)
MFRPLTLAVIALALVTPAHARDKTSEIDKIFSWATPDGPGCVCEVSQHGKVVVSRAYGSADLERNVPLSPASIFDAGSLMKQFVAAAILLQVEAKKVSLTDDVHTYIPELPDYGHKITINHLITHTSGIRDWAAMLPLSDSKENALTVILRQRGLNCVPGDEWSYSSSGFVLAREVVARTSGMSFREFAAKRLFEPLGMKSTSFNEDMRDVVKNRAVAYNREERGWRMAMMLDTERGGGGILTTAGDLLIWNDALTNHKLSAFVSQKLQEPTTLNNGRKLDYGRGLFLSRYRGSVELGHTGSADGYKSYLGRFPEQGLSIAIMCNSGDGTDRREFAYRIFDLFVPDDGKVHAEDGPPPAVAADIAADVEKKTGLFLDEKSGDFMRLAMDRGRFRIAGGPGLEPLSKDRFRRWGAFVMFMSQDAFELSFASPDQFELKSMEGKKTVYRRVTPWVPAAGDLKAFAGRYESNELGTVFGVEPKGDGLAVRLEHAPGQLLEFKPVTTDTFQFSRMTVRFVRDKGGNVVGLDYTNPLLRGVKFTRLSDLSTR